MARHVPATHAALLTRLRASVVEALGPVITASRGPFALVDFPNHSNVGDQAIWRGERLLLESLGAEVAYTCDQSSYDPARLRRRVGGGTVLVHGGGNFGDVWPEMQAFRERVVSDHRDRRVVILPQTIHFNDPIRQAEAAKVFAQHPNCVVVARDRTSKQIAETAFGSAQLVLSTDPAFLLSAPVAQPVSGVLWLSRRDGEQQGAAIALPSAEREAVDWGGNVAGEDGWTARYARLQRLTWDWGRRSTRLGRGGDLLHHAVERGYERLVDERLSVGWEMLLRRTVVVTDRLHGHILCCVAGQPHVVVDSGYGKLTAFLRDWTGSSPLVQVARDAADAERLAGLMLDGHSSP